MNIGFRRSLPALLIAAGIGFGGAGRAVAAEPVVRVALMEHAAEARVTIMTPCVLKDLATGQTLERWEDFKWQLIEPGRSGLMRLGKKGTTSREAVVLEPLGNEPVFRLNARPYRGFLIIRRVEGNRLLLINKVNLEDYLVSAIGSEIDPKWPAAALQAHAVASRTMVAHRIWVNSGQPFDVTADTRTHVYDGIPTERDSTRAAVSATAGEVLSFDGELFSAVFHANCGGHTEWADALWATKRVIPALAGHPDPYCRGAKHSDWEFHTALEDLQAALGPAAVELGRLAEVAVAERTRSGRVAALLIRGEGGESRIAGKDLRSALGANDLRSLKFDVRVEQGEARFTGQGWGHGVGMCQWGAYGMAAAGHPANVILDFYYPGAQRRKLAGLPGFDR
ncbi:MAG: hypothetical protein COV76_01755 [Candidatus Omnitrophica bacterium CG11_big_fil_rev_8_21_14_0_20_64_10]|nr:MAG: hypothetical protein COV76_01755 [Candidatus Omnitrophica bacterium CG11_big_fil_rev_8_21_14_0_20_64_10]